MTFGDIFRYGDVDYVFLGVKGENLHAARILDNNHTRQLIKLTESRIKKGADTNLNSSSVFCYVIFDTKELQGQACYFHNSQKDLSNFAKVSLINVKLTVSDLKKIKDEIVTRPVTEELKEIVKNISI